MASNNDDNNTLFFINPRDAFGRAGNEVRRALVVADKSVLVASIAMDAYLIGRAIHTDLRQHGIDDQENIDQSIRFCG